MKEKSIIKKTTDTIADSTDQVINQLKNGLSKIDNLGTSAKNKFINYVKDVFDVLQVSFTRWFALGIEATSFLKF